MEENAKGQRRLARLVIDGKEKESHNSKNHNQDPQKTISEHTNLKTDGRRQHGTAEGAHISSEVKSYNSHWGWFDNREEAGAWPGLMTYSISHII